MATDTLPIVQSADEPTPETSPDATGVFLDLKTRFGLLTDTELAERAAKSRAAGAAGRLVEGMIEPGTVNILVGDSGIGKSALVYQLALAVAAGRPFLGQRTRPGKVILVDYENSLWDSHRILRQQRRHLGLDAAPYTLMIWPMNQLAP